MSKIISNATILTSTHLVGVQVDNFHTSKVRAIVRGLKKHVWILTAHHDNLLLPTVAESYKSTGVVISGH